MASSDQVDAAESCVICFGSLVRNPVVRVDSFRLLLCQACGSWTAMPRPDAVVQHAFHDSDIYFEHPYLAHRRANPALVTRRCAAIFSRIGRVLDLAAIRGEPVMDVGCDTGEFILSAARQFGIRPIGIDVAHRAIERARGSGVEAYHCSVEEAPFHLKGLAAVTAIDLIEHVANPQSFFRSLFDRLRPGGVIYVETPNIHSCVYQVGRLLCACTKGRPTATFKRLFPEEHIQYFSRQGLERLADSCGFDIAYQQSRSLPLREIAVGHATRLALGALQSLDYVSGDRILRWAVLRRPLA